MPRKGRNHQSYGGMVGLNQYGLPKYSKKVAEEIIQRTEQGEYMSVICRDIGLHPSCVALWINNPKKKVGRRTFGDCLRDARKRRIKFNPALAAEIVDRVASGQTLTKASEEMGVPQWRIRLWRQDPEHTIDGKTFSDALAEARGEWGHELVDRAQDLNVGLSDGLSGDRHQDFARIRAVQQETKFTEWYVSKVLWPLYGDRVEHHHSGGVDHGITIKILKFDDAPAEALTADVRPVIEGELAEEQTDAQEGSGEAL